MSEENNISNAELSGCWELLHDMEERVRNTKFKMETDEIERVREMIRETDARCSDDSIPVKVVVTGRMKAGKSMMTDVLFFDGKGVLNSQVTPATANITYIRYKGMEVRGDAKVSFLKKDDVEEMENYLSKQSEDGESDNIADKVRYREIKKKLENINADPGKREVWINHVDEWVKKEELKDYSDVGGKYSDYVSQIEVYTDDSNLEDLEIVDTPGLGDPVASRSQKAREESRKAEVIFFLSRAEHFMDMEDADEFARLKRAGCKNIVVVMSQFDEVFDSDEEEELLDLRDTLVYDQLAEEGKERIKSAMKQAGTEYEPITIIPICALAAKLSYNTMEKDDAFYRNKMQPLFGNLADCDAVDNLSGMNSLKDEIANVKKEKERIREEFNQMKLQHCQKAVFHMYQELIEKINNEIVIKEYAIAHPENTGKVVNALDNWKAELSVNLEKEMGEINSMIDAECQIMKKEITGSASSAKAGIRDAQAPSSINEAYEITFKNPIIDMFEMGIEARLSLDNHSETHGKMFQHFRDGLDTWSVPKEVKAAGLDHKLYGILRNEFEARINKDYSNQLKHALPLNNVLEVLNEKYKTVLENSPDFKANRKLKSGKSKNEVSKENCKAAVDGALGTLHQTLDMLVNDIGNELLENIEDDLRAKIEDQIENEKLSLRTSTAQTFQAEIEKYKELLENLESIKPDNMNEDIA